VKKASAAFAGLNLPCAISWVFARFISYVPVTQASCSSYRVQRRVHYKSMKNFCFGITFKVMAVSIYLLMLIINLYTALFSAQFAGIV
jgi:hypothetical protein